MNGMSSRILSNFDLYGTIHSNKTNNTMKKLFYATAVVALACMTACSSLEREAGESALNQEISFLTLQKVNTKSPVDGIVFPDGYDMKVSAFHNLGSHPGDREVAADYFTGVTFSKSGTLWKEAKYWPLDGTLDFLVYATAGLKDAASGIVPSPVWGDAGNVARKVVLDIPDNSVKFDDILYGSSNEQKFIAAGNPLVLRHAETVVCFAAKANVPYDAVNNKGVTIDRITVDDAYYGGTLTILNPAAGKASGNLTAAWSALDEQKTHVAARVYQGASCAAQEPELTGLDLTATAASLNDKHFGEGYVILPEQPASRFTLTYTLHNGKDGDGTPLNNQMQYQYTCSGTWAQATKNLYTIDITLNEITVTPSVVDWTTASPVSVPIQNE